MTNFLTVAQQVAVLFVLMGVGFVLNRRKLLDDVAIKGVVNILILLVTPCIIIDVFQRPFDQSMLKGLGGAFVLSVMGHLLAIALSYALVRHSVEKTQTVLRVATVFSNAGFMGIPLEYAILGEKGVFYGIVYVAVFNLFMWSWGYCTMRGRRMSDKLPISMMLVNPGTVGIAIGLPLFFLPVELPTIIRDPVHFIAGMNTPLAMIVIGYYLAEAKVMAAVRMKTAWVASTIRLVGYPLLVLAMMYPFRASLDRPMMLALVIAAASPVAAMVSMFAAQYDRDVDVSVAMVSGTTLLSIVTIPVVVALAIELLTVQ